MYILFLCLQQNEALLAEEEMDDDPTDESCDSLLVTLLGIPSLGSI